MPHRPVGFVDRINRVLLDGWRSVDAMRRVLAKTRKPADAASSAQTARRTQSPHRAPAAEQRAAE